MNFAIIGCGFIAKKHAKAINDIKGAKLVAVTDKVPANMDFYAEEYGAIPYEDMDEMFKQEEIDIVCICTPTGLHAPLAIEAANAKKHIILEKPIAMTLEDSDKIIEACHENNVKLSIVHPNRYRPVVKELKKILDKNLLGKISHVNAIVNWNRNQEYYDQSPWRGTKEYDGGALMNQAIHNVDLLQWFMGKVEEVYSMKATRLRKIEAEDVLNGIVRFKSGALGIIQAATTVFPRNFEESITIFGEKGTVKIGGANAIYFKHLEIEGMTEQEASKLIQKVEKDPWGLPGHQCILQDMINSVESNNTPAISGEEARKSLELVLSLYQSADKNHPIKLEEEKSYASN